MAKVVGRVIGTVVPPSELASDVKTLIYHGGYETSAGVGRFSGFAYFWLIVRSEAGRLGFRTRPGA